MNQPDPKKFLEILSEHRPVDLKLMLAPVRRAPKPLRKNNRPDGKRRK